MNVSLMDSVGFQSSSVKIAIVLRSSNRRMSLKKDVSRLSFKAWDDSQQRLKFNKRWFSFHQHRDYEGKVCYIQILRDRVGTYWLYVITDSSITEPYSATGESVGIDFGMETYLTFSNGEKKQSPEFFKHALKELRTLNKAVSRKVKGSNNWWRCVRELAPIVSAYRQPTQGLALQGCY